MKNNSGNPNLPIKSDKNLPNIAQTNQLLQQAKVNDKALSSLLNSRDPEYWLKKVREALDKEAWTEAVFYGQKVLFYSADFVRADIVLAYAFGRLRDIDNSLFYMERVDRFEEVEAEVYRDLLSTLELYFLSVFSGIFGNGPESPEDEYDFFSEKLENIAQPLKLELYEVTYEELKTILIDNPDIHYLKIGNYERESLPKEIGQLTNLTSLDLCDNNLTILPKEIGQLTNLTSLNLWHNELTILPKDIGQLTNLTSLYLNSNKLTSLPKEIVQLTNLTSLDLWQNRLTSLPKEIVQLTNLTSLNLESNKLTILSKEIGQLTNLTFLGLRSLDFGQNNLI
jgi:Leucine-rich repeat (LRR) protein